MSESNQKRARSSHVSCPHCGGHAVIRTRETQVEHHVYKLYCQCVDVKNCGASWVMHQSFSHYIVPPAPVAAQMAMSVLAGAPPAWRQGEIFG